jgi:hypothetical protein
MVGEMPDNSTSNSGRSGARVKSFACPSCGASVMVRYPGASLSAVCSACNSVIDVTNENYAIISKYKGATGLFPLTLALGSRGSLDGKTWEVIGFVVRRDSNYYWEEYLLFNPYYGYRWLTQADGHWSLFQMIKKKPRKIWEDSGKQAVLDDKSYKLFNRGNAEVVYVIGEFYWKVIVNSGVDTTDYIRPPEMLSSEKSDEEIVWSLGKYIKPQIIQTAFKPERRMLQPLGIAPNQPSQATANWPSIRMHWLLCVVFLTFAEFYFAASAGNSLVSRQVFTFNPNTRVSDLSSARFTLDKALANAKIEIAAPVDNSWLWVSGDLVNNANGSTYPFERTVEYYHGIDSDGYWSEGGTANDQLISSVPGGEYYFNIDFESGDFKDTNVRTFIVSVWRDVSTFANYLWCLFFASIVPIAAWYWMRQDEMARWANSDFSPFPSQR